jgi:hypothetical protein
VQGFVFGVVAEGKQYGSVLVLTDDSSAPLWGRPPSLPASWQHSRGRDLSTAQPRWSPLSTPAADPALIADVAREHPTAKTIQAWWPAILAALTNDVSNAHTEGFNRVIKTNQAGRLRIPVHEQLPAPYPQPHRNHPTAKISSMNGTNPAQFEEPDS